MRVKLWQNFVRRTTIGDKTFDSTQFKSIYKVLNLFLSQPMVGTKAIYVAWNAANKRIRSDRTLVLINNYIELDVEPTIMFCRSFWIRSLWLAAIDIMIFVCSFLSAKIATFERKINCIRFCLCAAQLERMSRSSRCQDLDLHDTQQGKQKWFIYSSRPKIHHWA